MTNVAIATVDARPDGTWAVSVVRRDGEQAQQGAVLVRASRMPSPPDPEHICVAAARAWLLLAERRLAAKDWPAAIALARKGLAELCIDFNGLAFFRDDVFDDTEMGLMRAESELEDGGLNEAAEDFVGVLDSRIGLYLHVHKETVVGILPPREG